MPDEMVPIAILVSRPEAMVVASLLDAAGIIVHVGGEHHASVSINSLALGSYRLTVPEWQWADASVVIAESYDYRDFQFSKGLQTAVIKLLLAWVAAAYSACLAMYSVYGVWAWTIIWMPPLTAFAMPVNPQGRGDYFLCIPDKT